MARTSMRHGLVAIAAGCLAYFAMTRSGSDAFVVGPEASRPRAELVVMRANSGSDKRNSLSLDGRFGTPKAKGVRRKRLIQQRNLPPAGSRDQMMLPRRFPLYDILEEYDKTLPVYTIVEEPEEIPQPLEDVPLLERYPWAGELKRVHKHKQALEHGSEESRMEPLMGTWSWQNPGPRGARQERVYRKHYKMDRRVKYPPYLNDPKMGEKLKIPSTKHFQKHRTPELWQLKGSKRKEILKLQEKEQVDENGFVRAKGQFSIRGKQDALESSSDPLEALGA